MPAIAPSTRAPYLGSLVGGTILGASLVAVGLGLAYLTIATPFTASLMPAGRSASSQVAVGIWSFALIAGGSLLVAGTNRLAVTVASVRSRVPDRARVGQAMRALPGDVVVATGVILNDGPAIPTVAVGAFGAAILHELPPRDKVRQVDGFWEAKTRDGWRPTEPPLDAAVRDAERMRRWLAQGHLDFVVRVYAALITPDGSIPRSAACAVITPDQVPAWIGALPSQRSLTAARQHRLGAMIKTAVPARGKRRDR